MCRYIIKSGFHWGLEQALLARQHNTAPISIFHCIVEISNDSASFQTALSAISLAIFSKGR